MGSVRLPEPVEGWNPVPGESDRMMWWDGKGFTHEAKLHGDRWAVVGRELPARRMGRSGWITLVFGVPLLFVLVVVALVLSPVGGLFKDVEQQVGPGAGELRTELDSWTLPSTVQRAKRADESTAWSPGSTSTSVTRYYRARGVDATAAATDLVRALRTQGYALRGSGHMEFPATPNTPEIPGTFGLWYGPGKTEHTELSISVDDPGGRTFSAELADTGARSGGGE